MWNYRIKYILICIIIINLFLIERIGALNYYVNDNNTTGDRYCSVVGNNLNNGVTPATPTRTIMNIINKSNLGPGDTVYIDTGTYSERVTITPLDQGNSSGYLTFKGVASGGTNSYIRGNGADWWNTCIFISNADYIVIDSFYIKHSQPWQFNKGVKCDNTCSNLKIINNIIVSNGVEGIRFSEGNGNGVYYSIISNNICNYNNRGNINWAAGLILHKAYSNKILNNEFIKNGTGTVGNGDGIKIEEKSVYNIIKGNTCSSNYKDGIEIRDEVFGNENRYNVIRNNIISRNSQNGISGAGWSGIEATSVINNKCYYNGKDGISFYFSGDSNDNNIIISNTCFSNHDQGIHVDGKNNFFSYNLCYSNGSYGMEIKGDGPNTNIFCVCYKNGADGIRMISDANKSLIRNCTLFKNNNDGFVFQSGAGGVEVRNCISLSNGEYGYCREAGGAVNLKYSDVYGNSSGNYNGITVGTGCITSNPVFISIIFGQSDFVHLSNISPCVDTGDPNDPIPRGGNACIDMGRYEYVYTNTAYYVNDLSINGDMYCTAKGNDSNPGTSPSSPKATITNLLSTYSLKQGNFVYVDTGRYTDKVIVTTNDDGNSDNPIIFLGAGNTRTIVSNDRKGNIFHIKGESQTARVKGVKILNFQFVGGEESVKFDKCTCCILTNCKVLNYSNNGVVIWDTNDNIKIADNYIKGKDSNNSILIGWESSTNTIYRNTLIGNRKFGIYITQWGVNKHNIISFNHISSNTNGISAFSPYNKISNNYIYNNDVNGIELNNGGTDNHIIGNQIYNNLNGIFVQKDNGGGKNSIIRNNNIYNNTNGIQLGIGSSDNPDARNNIIFRNSIHHNNQKGIIVYSPSNVISTNIIYNHGSDGIVLDWGGRHNTIKSNNIYINSAGIMIFREYNKVSNNRCYYNNNGIEFSWDGNYNTIFGNELCNNWYDGLNQNNAWTVDNNFIISNKIHHNINQGISMHGGNNKHNTFIGNVVWSNHGSEAGIKVEGEGNVFLYNICYSNNGSGFLINGKNGSITNKFNKCYRNKKHGIKFQDIKGGIIMDNSLYANIKDGINCNNSDNLLIINNIINSNSGGISFTNDSDSNMVFENLIYRNIEKGITLNFNCNNNSIINNTIFKHSSYGIDIDGTSDAIIKNIITMSNLKGINKTGAAQSVSYCCTNDGVNNVSGTGSINDDPLFYSVTPGSEDFRLRWNSPCIGTAEPSAVAGSMGFYPQYNSIDQPIILAKSKHSVFFTTLYSNGSVPNNGKINIQFPAGFNLNNVSFYTTTSSWGGNPGNFSTSRVGQTITITRSGGNDSVPGQTENLILTNIVNPNIPGENYKILIETKDNFNNIIETIDGNYFCIVSNTIMDLSKSIFGIQISGVDKPAIPGSSIEYCVKMSNSGHQTGWSLLIYDKVSEYTIYKTNSIRVTNNWYAEFSTNLNPDQSYNSKDYTNIEFPSSDIKWVRWKTKYLEQGMKDLLYYSVIIK